MPASSKQIWPAPARPATAPSTGAKQDGVAPTPVSDLRDANWDLAKPDKGGAIDMDAAIDTEEGPDSSKQVPHQHSARRQQIRHGEV